MATVLCVDWDERLTTRLAAHLAGAGHDCVTETRGDRVCHALRQSGADAVVMEVMLPGICGFEVCRRIRADRAFYTLPVLLMSGMAADEEVRHGLTQGADDYLPKPFEPGLLVSRLQGLLAGMSGLLDPEPLTGLVGHRLTKYEIHHRICNRKPFALACLELANLVQFGRSAGEEARLKVLRHAAELVEDSGKTLGDPEFLAAHMGAGHFVALVTPENANRFCSLIFSGWQKAQEALYLSLGIAPAIRQYELAGGMPGGIPPVQALVYCTGNRSITGGSAQDCFEVLGGIRSHARNAGTGIYSDRRIR